MPATGEGQQLQMSQISECLNSPALGAAWEAVSSDPVDPDV